MSYLRSNSTIILPKRCQLELDQNLKINQSSDDDNDSWDDTTDKSSDQDKTNYPEFNELDDKIINAMKKFNNKVFIKLNWSSPKDAFWSLSKLSCECLSDVYILLKSSDFITHDLVEPFNCCEDFDKNSESVKNFKYVLVIREWFNINPSMEFRCFVKNNMLIGFYFNQMFE